MTLGEKVEAFKSKMTTMEEVDLVNSMLEITELIMTVRPIEVGDIVQLDPEKTGNKAFAACFMVVSEVKPWGVQGYVTPLGKDRDTMPEGHAYYRAETGTFERTFGRACWVQP